MSTYAYTRISKDRDNSVAVEDQIRKIRAFAEATDRVIDRVFEDRDASGRSLERPQMIALLALVKPGDTIIVHKLDRLTRSVRDLGDLIDRKINMVSVSESLDTNSASGRLVVNILATVAQWERETIAERTSASLGYKRDAGKVYGSIPYGYMRVNNADSLEESPPEQMALARVRYLKSTGIGVTEIARQLNAIPAFKALARGQQWYPHSITSVLGSGMETARAARL